MKQPAFWRGGLDPRSREAAPLTRALLTPLAKLYAAEGARRIARAAPTQIGAKIVCVGNLTLGGAGKTPIARALRDRFTAGGSRAATLSRGYKGRLQGPLRVDPAAMTADEVGDEPLMLAASGEAWIGKDRAAAARAMAADGVDVVILDDGHQSQAVAKDLSLVVIDTGDPFGNGHVFPKGPLREPVADGLRRADAVALLGDGPTPDLGGFKGPVLRARLAPSEPPPDGPLVAFAGIGRPEKFFDTLRAAGADLVDAAPFEDHHRYTPGDLRFLKKLARDREARLITTEKNAARLAPADRADMLVFPVRAVFKDDDALDALLAPVLAEARP